MTDNQKQAIVVLNRLHNTYGLDEKSVLTDEEYFMFLEFIINKQETQYVPWPIETPSQPYTPWQTQPWTTEPIYCKDPVVKPSTISGEVANTEYTYQTNVSSTTTTAQE